MSFEESLLAQALKKPSAPLSDIISALGSATTDLSLRRPNGSTYVHELASASVENSTKDEYLSIWSTILDKVSPFVRRSDGESGLDLMETNLPVDTVNAVLKAYLEKCSKEDKVGKLVQDVTMSGKIPLLANCARAARLSEELIAQLTAAEDLSQQLAGVHKDLRDNIAPRDLNMQFSKRGMVLVEDYAGLPVLHLCVVYGMKEVVDQLVATFPESVNQQDFLGRTAMHYAVSQTGSELTVQRLAEAGADESLKDVLGRDVAATKATPINITEFKAEYERIVERNTIKDQIARIHAAILTGNVRTVKMYLTRKELATKTDASKLTPLHKAIIMKSKDIIDYLVEQFPTALDVQGKAGLTPMHFAAVVDAELYETLKKVGGDCHTVDVEGNDPEYYKDHVNDFPLDLDRLRSELLITPPTRPVSAAVSNRSRSAKSGKASAGAARKVSASAAASRPVIAQPIKKKASPPETLDAKYIAESLGDPLTAALAEVAEKRPWDPIEFLAQWLYKHKANLEYHQRQMDAVKEAELAEIRKGEEREARARRKREAQFLKDEQERKAEEERKKKEEEERKKKEQEELQKRAKESVHLAQAPELATVTEDAEEAEAAAVTLSPRDVVIKDEAGQTELHRLIVSGSVEEVTTLLAGGGASMLAERDANGKTPRDLTDSDEIRQALDAFVAELATREDKAEFTKLVADGYTIDKDALQSAAPEADLADLESITIAKDVEAITKAIRSGVLRDVKQTISKKELARVRCDKNGGSPLHLAVLYQYERPDILAYLLQQFQGIVQCRDFANRTALHYAYGLPEASREAVVKQLIDAGADAEAADCKERLPADYAELTEEIQALKEAEPESMPQAEDEAPTDAAAEAPAEGETPAEAPAPAEAPVTEE